LCEKPGKNSDTDDETRAAGECGIPPAPGKAVLFADGKQKRALVLRMTQNRYARQVRLVGALTAHLLERLLTRLIPFLGAYLAISVAVETLDEPALVAFPFRQQRAQFLRFG